MTGCAVILLALHGFLPFAKTSSRFYGSCLTVLTLSFKLKRKLLAAIKEQNQALTPTLNEEFDFKQLEDLLFACIRI